MQKSISKGIFECICKKKILALDPSKKCEYNYWMHFPFVGKSKPVTE